jgi:hypothetical protein
VTLRYGNAPSRSWSTPVPRPVVGQHGRMPYLVTPVVPSGRMRDLGQPVLPGAGGLVLRPWKAGDAPVVLEA